ncbi:MAG: hypothetical protein KC425_00840 [Anaerolineales bacterium]|nr:hypothetical protein [Anaerolineales bacterium]
MHLLAARPEPGGALAAQDLQRAAAHLPNCKVAVLEDAGHDIHLDQSGAILDAWRHFGVAVQ